MQFIDGCLITSPIYALKKGIGLNENTESHGTAVYGLISSPIDSCPGLVPKAAIYMVKIFNSNKQKDQVETIIDALRFLEQQSVDIVNMSFGNYELQPAIVEKIVEMTSKSTIFLASAGNDGP